MVQIAKLVRKKLGEILVEEGLLKEEQVQEGLKRQKGTGELLGEAFVNLGYLSEYDIARAIVKQFGLPYLDASKYNIPKEATQAVSADLMYQNQFVVLDKIGRTLLVALSGIVNSEVLEKLEKVSNSQLFVYVSTSSQVMAALKKHWPQNGKPPEAPTSPAAKAAPAAAKPAGPPPAAPRTTPPGGTTVTARPGAPAAPSPRPSGAPQGGGWLK